MWGRDIQREHVRIADIMPILGDIALLIYRSYVQFENLPLEKETVKS